LLDSKSIVSLSNATTSSASTTIASPDFEHEYRAATSSAAFRLLEDRLIVRISGDDRASFMHGMCSGDIKGMKPDAALPALFLTEHAHVIADFFVYATEDDALLIDIDRTTWPQVRAHLDRFLVADDVEMDELDELCVIEVEGLRSSDVVRAIAGDAAGGLERWHTVKTNGLRFANLPRFGGPAFSIITDRDRAAEFLRQAEAVGAAGSACFLSQQTLDLLRIEHGIARIGADTNEKTLALEARLDRAISFNKGCYVGQETVERATARGGLKRRLYGIRIDGRRSPSMAARVMLDHKEVGRLTSIGHSPVHGIIGLAIVHHSAWSEGTRVAIVDSAGELSGRISDLPFKSLEAGL
jgi:folate-binding protein YgfZ